MSDACILLFRRPTRLGLLTVQFTLDASQNSHTGLSTLVSWSCMVQLQAAALCLTMRTGHRRKPGSGSMLPMSRSTGMPQRELARAAPSASTRTRRAGWSRLSQSPPALLAAGCDCRLQAFGVPSGPESLLARCRPTSFSPRNYRALK